MNLLRVMSRNRRGWLIYIVMVAATLISCFQQAGLATVSANIADALRVEPASLGLLSAAFFYAYAAMQLPAGLLSDSLGPRKSVTAALLLAAAGTVLFALADSLGAAAAGRAVMGAGLAVVLAPQLKLIAVWFPPGAFSRLTAVAFAATSFGPLLATSPMAYAAAAFGWRPPFLLLAAFTLACAGLVWLAVRDWPDSPPRPEQLLRPAGACFAAVAAGSTPETRPAGSVHRKLAALGKNRTVWLLALWQSCQGGAYFAFLGLWGGQYLTQGLGLEATEAGWILIPSACALLAAPLLALAAERFSTRRVMLVLSACSSLCLFPIFLGLPKLPAPALAAYFLFFSVAAIGGAPVIFSAAKELFDTSLAGTASGLVNMFAFAGAAVLQQGMGVLVEHLLNGGAGAFEAQSRAYGFFLAAALLSLLLAWRYRPTPAAADFCRKEPDRTPGI